MELRRLIRVHRAYDHMNRGDLAVEHGDVDGALREYSAAEAMFPDNLEMKFWHAVALVNAGRTAESLPIFEAVFKADRNWATLVPRLPASGSLTADENDPQAHPFRRPAVSRLTLRVPRGFDFWRTVLSHGWAVLPPFECDRARRTLRRVFRLTHWPARNGEPCMRRTTASWSRPAR